MPFRAIFKHAAIGIGLVSASGIILQANRRLCEMFGLAQSTLVGQSIADVTHPDDLAVDLSLFDELVRGMRTSYQIEKRYVRGDGAIMVGRLTTSLVRRADGTAKYSHSCSRDSVFCSRPATAPTRCCTIAWRNRAAYAADSLPAAALTVVAAMR